MINASALEKVKLKATAEVAKKDRSDPIYMINAVEESEEKEEKRRNYFFSTGLDRWYKSLQDVTIPSKFLNISADEARAIISYWKSNYCHKASHEPVPEESQVVIPDTLKGLGERISEAISSLSSNKCGFVKLSTRSPKDSHIAFAKAREAYVDEKDTVLVQDASGNDKLTLLGKAVVKSLRVKNGEEALKLFVSSDRVGEDLEYALEPGDANINERISVVVREWVDIPLWAEFRGFVWNGKLTSIGQYSHPVLFPELLEKAPVIQKDLEKFFDFVKPKIPLDRYIIDFGWTDDRVYLIEINPFDGELVFPASTGLWSWEEDRQQMMYGPLELRLRHEKQSDIVLKKTLDPQWRTVLFS